MQQGGCVLQHHHHLHLMIRVAGVAAHAGGEEVAGLEGVEEGVQVAGLLLLHSGGPLVAQVHPPTRVQVGEMGVHLEVQPRAQKGPARLLQCGEEGLRSRVQGLGFRVWDLGLESESDVRAVVGFRIERIKDWH